MTHFSNFGVSLTPPANDEHLFNQPISRCDYCDAPISPDRSICVSCHNDHALDALIQDHCDFS